MRDEGPNLKFPRPLFLPEIGKLRPLVGFELLHERLVAYVIHKLRIGEMTERGLARVTGVSQPHLHHVLKGKRLFSAQMADRVMGKLHVDLVTLLEEEGVGMDEPPTATLAAAVPLVEGRLGPGQPFPNLEVCRGAMPFLVADVEKMARPLAVRAGGDPAVRHLLEEGDVLLMEGLGRRAEVDFSEADRYYAVDAGVYGLIRQVEPMGDQLVLRAARGEVGPAAIRLEGRSVMDVVRARVVWVGRYLEKG